MSEQPLEVCVGRGRRGLSKKHPHVWMNCSGKGSSDGIWRDAAREAHFPEHTAALTTPATYNTGALLYSDSYTEAKATVFSFYTPTVHFTTGTQPKVLTVTFWFPGNFFLIHWPATASPHVSNFTSLCLSSTSINCRWKQDFLRRFAVRIKRLHFK